MKDCGSPTVALSTGDSGLQFFQIHAKCETLHMVLKTRAGLPHGAEESLSSEAFLRSRVGNICWSGLSVQGGGLLTLSTRPPDVCVCLASLGGVTFREVSWGIPQWCLNSDVPVASQVEGWQRHATPRQA